MIRRRTLISRMAGKAKAVGRHAVDAGKGTRKMLMQRKLDFTLVKVFDIQGEPDLAGRRSRFQKHQQMTVQGGTFCVQEGGYIPNIAVIHADFHPSSGTIKVALRSIIITNERPLANMVIKILTSIVVGSVKG